MDSNIELRERRRGEKESRKLTLDDLYDVVYELLENEHAWPFAEPVDYVKLGLQDYLSIVKTPMDLGTIKRRLEDGKYTDPQKVMQDINIVWKNTYLYNKKNSQIYEYAEELEKEFRTRITAMEEGKEPELPDKEPKESDICGVCSEGGQLLICDGDCFQAFHLRCVGLTSAPKTPLWFCSRCKRDFKGVVPTTVAQHRAIRIANLYNKPLKSLESPSSHTSSLLLAKQPAALPPSKPFPFYSQLVYATPPSTIWKGHPVNHDRQDSSTAQQPPQMLVGKREAPVHLQKNLSREAKIARREIEESLKEKYMEYDPFWCIWRPRIDKQEYLTMVDSLLAKKLNKEEET